MRQTHAHPARPSRPGFTLVELLVTISIVAVVLAILGVGLAQALSGGRRAATEQQLRTIAMGVEQFKSDFNYYPLLLNDDAAALNGPDRFTAVDGVNGAGERDPNEAPDARFHSIFSLPFYIVGHGDLAPRGYLPDNPERNDGVSGPGFRDPGPDRAWGGARQRTTSTHRPSVQGRSYGPYIEVANKPDVFRVAVGDDFRRFNEDPAGVEAFNQLQRDPQVREDIFVLADRWDKPIRYYRGVPNEDPSNPSRRSLERTPIELISSSTIRASVAGVMDAALEKNIQNAPFVLLSGGEDGDVASPMPDDDNDNTSRGFVDALIDSQFRNSEGLAPFTEVNASLTKRNRLNALYKSLDNNVKVTP